MTEDEIVRLYKKSTGRDIEGYYNTIEELKKFAEAVAKAAVAAADLEACAKLVEQMGMEGYGTLAIAASIRARGEK